MPIFFCSVRLLLNFFIPLPVCWLVTKILVRGYLLSVMSLPRSVFNQYIHYISKDLHSTATEWLATKKPNHYLASKYCNKILLRVFRYNPLQINIYIIIFFHSNPNLHCSIHYPRKKLTMIPI